MAFICNFTGTSCGRNEEYQTCGGCQATCDNRNPRCTKECKRGCYCKRGLIREKEGGSCIPVKKCPKGANTFNIVKTI